VLALIPIAGIGYLIYWYRKKRDGSAQEVTASNNPGNQDNQLNQQPQTYFSPQAPSLATHGSDSGFPSGAPPSRVRQDPPADPPASAPSVHAVLAAAGPDVKDQCREVIPDPRRSGPPLAHAIVIDPSEGSEKSC